MNTAAQPPLAHHHILSQPKSKWIQRMKKNWNGRNCFVRIDGKVYSDVMDAESVLMRRRLNKANGIQLKGPKPFKYESYSLATLI